MIFIFEALYAKISAQIEQNKGLQLSTVSAGLYFSLFP